MTNTKKRNLFLSEDKQYIIVNDKEHKTGLYNRVPVSQAIGLYRIALSKANDTIKYRNKCFEISINMEDLKVIIEELMGTNVINISVNKVPEISFLLFILFFILALVMVQYPTAEVLKIISSSFMCMSIACFFNAVGTKCGLIRLM